MLNQLLSKDFPRSTPLSVALLAILFCLLFAGGFNYEVQSLDDFRGSISKPKNTS